MADASAKHSRIKGRTLFFIILFGLMVDGMFPTNIRVMLIHSLIVKKKLPGRKASLSIFLMGDGQAKVFPYSIH